MEIWYMSCSALISGHGLLSPCMFGFNLDGSQIRCILHPREK